VNKKQRRLRSFGRSLSRALLVTAVISLYIAFVNKPIIAAKPRVSLFGLGFNCAL
jgi:hypothetical protein